MMAMRSKGGREGGREGERAYLESPFLHVLGADVEGDGDEAMQHTGVADLLPELGVALQA